MSPLSSTPPKFNTKGPLLFSPQNLSVPHQKPLSSTQPPQFHTRNPSVQHTPSVPHQKPFSSTPKPPQFHTKNPSVPHQKRVTVKLAYLELFWCGTEGFFVLNWGGVLNWGVFGVELRDFGGGKGMALLCGTDVLNWGGCGTEGDPLVTITDQFGRSRKLACESWVPYLIFHHSHSLWSVCVS